MRSSIYFVRIFLDAPKSVEIIGYSEIEEQGREAWYRHLRQTWKPRLVLNENSITCENHATAKERSFYHTFLSVAFRLRTK